MQINKIILVFKTHFDIGFTRLSREIVDYYSGEMLDQVAETCNATKDMGKLKYVWTMPSWPLEVMLDRADSDHKKILNDLMERGQLVWHALSFTSHYDFCGVEDAIWGLRVVSIVFRTFFEKRALRAPMIPPESRAGGLLRCALP